MAPVKILPKSGKASKPPGSAPCPVFKVIPDDESRPLRRSRTGCFTCRRRKKKCPEEYEGDVCLRCKAGGWRCVRPPISSGSSASDSVVSPLSASNQEGPSSVVSDTTLPTSVRNVTQRPKVIPLSSIRSQLDSGIDIPPPPSVSTSVAPALAVSPSTAFVLADFNDLVGSGLDIYGADPVGVDSNRDDPMTSWYQQSIDALLSEAFHPIDLTMYESLGQIGPMPTTSFTPFPPLSSGFDATSTAGLDVVVDEAPIVGDVIGSMDTAEQSIISLPDIRPVSQTKEVEDTLLSQFYDLYIAPAWSITYPQTVREATYNRYKELSETHLVSRTCRQAVAASYLSLLQQPKSNESLQRKMKPYQLAPAFKECIIDPEPHIRAATILARSPKDPSLTIEAHLWALGDLHMAVGAFCDASQGYAVFDMAKQILQLTYGSKPDFDVESKFGHSSFFLRAFAMIDLNRSLCQRTRTFFNFEKSPVRSSFMSDGSHDIWFGLPSGLVIILARIFNFIADVTEDPTSRSVEDIEAFAKTTQDELRSWKPKTSLFDFDVPRHPLEYAAEFAVEQEIWRNLGLIIIDWLVLRLPLSHSPTMTTAAVVLSLLQSLPSLSAPRSNREQPLIDFWSSFYTTPAFLVGSLLTDPRHRQFIRNFLFDMGPEKAIEDMIMVLEMTWNATDRSGQVADWFWEAKRSDTVIVFF